MAVEVGERALLLYVSKAFESQASNTCVQSPPAG